MNWSEVQSRLAADRGQWSLIARETGLHVNGIRLIALRKTLSPRISTVEKIIAYYERVDALRSPKAA